MKKILILGSKGTLGQSFAKLYGGAYELTAWDREDLDITDFDRVREQLTELKPDLIINCVAYNAVDKAEEDVTTANLINGYAVGNLAKTAKDVNAVFIHFSSNYVFDGRNPEGYREDAIPNPISKYGESKLLGERETATHAGTYYLVRSAWLYGQPGISAASKKNYVQIMLDLSQEKNTIEAVSDQIAQPTYTKDLAEATKALVDSGMASGIYHLTNSGSASWLTWAELIFKVKNIAIKLVPTFVADFPKHPAARPQYGILINTKRPPLRSWQDALVDYLSSAV